MASGPIISNVVQTVLVLLWMGFGVYFFRGKKLHSRALIEYENEFLETHYGIIDRQRRNSEEVIPLTLRRQDREYLTNLCKKYDKFWRMTHCMDRFFHRSREPGVETHYLHFRKLLLAPRRMRIQVVRCAESYALIDAANGRSGYLLKVDGENTDGPSNLVFNINMKFLYESPETAQEIEIVTNQSGPIG